MCSNAGDCSCLQVIGCDALDVDSSEDRDLTCAEVSTVEDPCEKWLKRSTSMKVRVSIFCVFCGFDDELRHHYGYKLNVSGYCLLRRLE